MVETHGHAYEWKAKKGEVRLAGRNEVESENGRDARSCVYTEKESKLAPCRDEMHFVSC